MSFKKILAAVLSVIMILGVSPLASFSASAETIHSENTYYYYTVNNGEATLVDYTRSASMVSIIQIPSTLGGYPVVAIGNSACDYKSYAYKLTVPSGVRSIGNQGFNGCNALRDVMLPDTLVSIGSSAFSNCYALETISIPKTVTSIGGSAFRNCGLKSVELPCGITDISNVLFIFCRSLKSVTMPEGVKSIGDGAFYGCSSLLEITIPTGVTAIEAETFKECTSLTSVTLSNNIKKIASQAFENCPNLTDVYFYGTQEDKNNITINSYNDAIINAEWHFLIRYGDADDDGFINASDLVVLRTALLKLSAVDEETQTKWDVNADDQIDILDLVRLKKYIAGMDVVLGPTE